MLKNQSKDYIVKITENKEINKGEKIMTITEADKTNWESLISEQSKPVIAMFYMVSCSACNKIKPVFEDLAEKTGDKVSFIRIEAMDNIDITNSYGIRSAPMFLIFRNGEVVKTLDAPKEDELRAEVAAL